MSPDILKEMDFLLSSIFLGIGITFIYDWLRITRRLICHNNFCVSIEDFLFWIFASIATFYMLYTQNNGVLRWFAVCGAAIGMFLYKLCISRYFVKAAVFLLGIIGKGIKQILAVFWKPVIYSAKKAAGANRKLEKKILIILRLLKKKLTMGLKTIKIVLCKR